MKIVILLYTLAAMVTVANTYSSVPDPGLNTLRGLSSFTFTAILGVIQQTLSVAPTITHLFLNRTLPLFSSQYLQCTYQHWTETVITISVFSVEYCFPHFPWSEK